MSGASGRGFGVEDDDSGAASRSFFGGETGGTDAGSVVTSPYGWVLASAACATASVLVGLAADGRPGLAILGWVIGGFCSIGLLTVFTTRDGRLRADSWYLPKRWPETLRLVVAVLAAVGVGLNAWWFADAVSRTVGA